ncbi:N-acetyltransferase [Rathayibacter rathayi]|uniref:GNAT family N-acetyltransferase n=1 Tax=Rathayibacter rathayi TaxID=33887 RepID=UPI000BCAC05D|nr:GNAT family protein [Rathayibacter rathayi]AZZ48385.1 N-acetyltransferase [Rathayibacter rathayi]MWV74289.1 GNAT family N-acetyltransferase [Rathayibacter rathayi NCPPB 2980 = VKM Ac-1601]PPF49304.1 N-acetyltransferase [Rathayibacter rathayi]PPF81818.1 N-acetyltransferase [Rathayibacter rathayi]PPG13472.1 N-acetyltransferase [Rathayibacter rathayi]
MDPGSVSLAPMTQEDVRRLEEGLSTPDQTGIDASRRGQGIGSLAQRLLVEYLFAGTRAERIQAYTDVDNRAERRALEQAGFEEEGVLRRAQWRDGAWHDLVLFSTLRR